MIRVIVMITLSKIAKLANVSVSTASKAFSGSNEVNEETREMIFNIAKQNGCFKKFYNAKYPKLVIAIIAPEFESAYYARYLTSIQKMLKEENCEFCVSTTAFSPENEEALLEYYYKHSNVDGIIIINPRTDMVSCYELPIVAIGHKGEQGNAVSVTGNIESALRESVDYLVKKRVTSVGFISERLTAKKLQLFEKILNENSMALNNELVSITDERFEIGGYRAMEELFAKGRVPRAIVCAYDNMAIGAIRCIYDHGLSVPRDVAVLGMDDIPEARFLNPPLASLASDTEELCRIATETLMKQIAGEEVVKNQTVSSKFCLRESFTF